jgi:hypothetical protein
MAVCRSAWQVSDPKSTTHGSVGSLIRLSRSLPPMLMVTTRVSVAGSSISATAGPSWRSISEPVVSPPTPRLIICLAPAWLAPAK